MSVSYEELPFGLTWVVDEPMRRTSHALADDGRVWFVDPVAEPEALERARALGEVAGVLQLLDGHGRGVHGRTAADGLTRALDHSWRDLPKAMLAVLSALRDHPKTPRRPGVPG